MMGELQTINDSTLKMYAATAMAQSLSFSMERKYLEGIGNSDLNPLFQISEIKSTPKSPISWINITQIGKPLQDNADFVFTAMQKILYSCFMPEAAQLLFLITNDGISNKMYLGIRPINNSVDKRFTRQLNEFMKGQWPGLKCETITETQHKELTDFASKNFASGKSDNVFAITGIPSMESQYKNIYPATVDQLMAGMNGCKDFAYLVVADPINSSEVDNMLFQCREMNGQAESLKSFNLSEGKTKGLSKSIAEGINWNSQDSVSTSKSGKDWEGAWNKIKGGAGVGLVLGGIAVAASVAFPPAAAAMGAIASSVGASGAIAAGSTLLGLMGNKSKSKSHSDSYGGSKVVTEGMSESQSQTVSHNVVNKHIEAISEHLFYHGKRLETGKAIGMWKVGAYLITSRESDAKAGTMQLRSILSGQESIYEPIRITNISDSIQIANSFARLQSPNLYIQMMDKTNFIHPLGDNYSELKTVLTTKELSYLINFPMMSVPGISVVDSSPNFSLNQPELGNEENINFGKLLYGGTQTEIEYNLPLNSLSKHTLLSGINGTGKTNTVQSILNNISEKIPFLIIEPAKTEYIDWALEFNKTHSTNPIDIYIPGCKKYKGTFVPKSLHINPFEIVWLNKEQEPNILSHIDRLKSTFAAAFPMYDILPILMEDLIYSIYQNKSTDWLTTTPEFKETLPPTLNSMSINVDKVIGNRGYEERIERNMRACLNTRIDSLKRGWKGEMLNVLHSINWSDLFERPVIINLSYVGDDLDKSFFMSLILQFLYEYRIAKSEIGDVNFNDNNCKHLTVIEEAHRVMSKCDSQDSPLYKTAMMFSNMLSEIRAYGEGMFLVDQVPTRLIPDAIKNTNTKITHRLVSEDDCKAIAASMSVSKEQKLIIPKLRVGQCIVSTSLSTDKHWVQVNKVK